jgi:hypothetical protein
VQQALVLVGGKANDGDGANTFCEELEPQIHIRVVDKPSCDENELEN